MTTTRYSLVIGIFRDHALAAQAINELHSAGFRDNKLRVGKAATASDLQDRPASQLTGYAAEGKTLPEELADKGIPADEAQYYQQEFEAGHSIVIVESYGHQQAARAILQRHGAYNANTHAEQTAYNRVIPLREEVLQAHKQLVKTGEVILRKVIITEEKTFTVAITREELIVERHPASPQPPDQPTPEGQTLDDPLKDGQTLRIVLREEQIHIEKRPVIKEEIFVTKRQIEQTRHFSDTLKREEVQIERIGNIHIRESNGDIAPES